MRIHTATITISISIHSPHARGDLFIYDLLAYHDISIHSPHARGDVIFLPTGHSNRISIHSPHARGDVVKISLMS